MKHIVFALILFIINTAHSYADTLHAKLEFTRRPPYTGVLYIDGGQNTFINLEMNHRDKQFSHKILAGSPGKEVIFKNNDEFEHNLHIHEPLMNFYQDLGMLEPGSRSSVSIRWQPNSLARVHCKIHPRMESYIANIISSNYHTYSFEHDIQMYETTLKNLPLRAVQVRLLMPDYDDLAIYIGLNEKRLVNVTRNGEIRGILSLERKQHQ